MRAMGMLQQLEADQPPTTRWIPQNHASFAYSLLCPTGWQKKSGARLTFSGFDTLYGGNVVN
jgi:hypothetical protein